MPPSQETLQESRAYPVIMPPADSSYEQENTEQDEQTDAEQDKSTDSATTFADVIQSSPYYLSSKWAIYEGIVDGEESATAPCTKEDAILYIWRAMGCEIVNDVAPYSDLDFMDTDYSKAANWAYVHEIEVGSLSGSDLFYNGTTECTRIQAMEYLWRLAGSPKDTLFQDIPSNKTDEEWAVEWAVENGITRGIAESVFAPNYVITRAQMIVFLYRYGHLIA